MSQIENEIYIERPPRPILDVVSSPARWSEWNPQCAGVTAEAGALTPGARFETQTRLARRDWQLRWIVRDLRPGLFWIADGESGDGLRLQLRYDVHGRGNGSTLIERLDYALPTFWLRLLNPLLLRRRIDRESAQALIALKRVIEAQAKRGAP